MAAVFSRLREAHQANATRKGLELRFVHSRTVAASDAEALFTILNNLVMNAINYTARGKVLVGCRRRGRRCRIEVHDTGPGIAPGQQAAIFDAFRRLQTDDTPGLGLGLTIVKETAAFLEHRVCLYSVPGRGTCFCVEASLWSHADEEKRSGDR